MIKTKEDSRKFWETFVSLYCKGYRATSKELQLHWCTVDSLVHQWKEWGSTVTWQWNCQNGNKAAKDYSQRVGWRVLGTTATPVLVTNTLYWRLAILECKKSSTFWSNRMWSLLRRYKPDIYCNHILWCDVTKIVLFGLSSYHQVLRKKNIRI